MTRNICVGVGSGFDALHLALRAWEIGPGDEVIVPRTHSSPPGSLSPLLVLHPFRSSRTRRHSISIRAPCRRHYFAHPCIIPVHLYGQPADMEPINAIAEKHGLKVLEDAAQAQGAHYKGRRVARLGSRGAQLLSEQEPWCLQRRRSDNY